MDYDYGKIGRDLENMRDRMDILRNRYKQFRFPRNIGVLAYSFYNDRSLSKYNSLKKNINQTYNSLKKEYPKLREIYSNRGDNLSLDELLSLNQIKTDRIIDLRQRKELLKSMRKKGLFHVIKNKKINNLVKEVDNELDRRERNINDLVEEVVDRGYDMEVIYTQKMMENIYKN